jgi:hypothetical protein
MRPIDENGWSPAWRAGFAVFLTLAGVAVSKETRAQIKAVPLPDPKVPGFVFPEREATILGWVKASGDPTNPQAQAAASSQINLHGWGLWTALTAETDQVIEGQKLRVLETWYTPEDLTSPSAQGLTMESVVARRRGRGRLEPIRQLRHANPGRARVEVVGPPPAQRITGFVKYDPSAARHIVSRRLFVKSVVDGLLAHGASGISPFPNNAVALKPVFQVITRSHLKEGRYYPLPVWTGPPPEPRSYGPSVWPAVVWIDLQGGGAGVGAIDMTLPTQRDGSTRTDPTTYPIASLINFRLSAEDAANSNANARIRGGPIDAAAGDYSILVAMHVTSREVSRWTWQTFWWTPSPDLAVAPSSNAIVAARPAQLKDASRNYAMAIAYATETPAQPDVGGANVGESLYAYNPWLEAIFGPADLPDSVPGVSQGQPVANNVGTRSNCMSCHAAANYNPASLATAPAYSGDRYFSLDDLRFRGTLTVDFLWSIPGNVK